jgi:biotin synthase
VRHDWTRAEIQALFDLPFPDLIFHAQRIHRQHFDPHEVQISTLLSIKTGGCPEDCAYCPQSAHHNAGVAADKLMDVAAVVEEARAARAAGASRFCMGAAWRAPKDRDLDQVCAMVEGVRALGLETCATLGMLTAAQTASSTARSFRPAPTRTDWTPSPMCARPEFTCAAAASSAWVRSATTASA